MEPLLNIAISAARQAGDVIVRHMELLDRVKVTPKSAYEVFSEVDIKAEQAILQTIQKSYPQHNILAEESGFYEGSDEPTWIIDPLDGTSNFLHGYPYFSVSIGIKIKNRIEHGVIYDPLRHECFAASRGRGARLNDRRIRVSKQTQMESSLLATGVPFKNPALAQRYLPTLEALVGKCAGVRRSGSAALDLAYVAAARLDGFWEIGLRPWDIAAGTLIIREAGGLVSDPFGGEEFMKSGDVVAGTPKVFKTLLQTIMPVIKG